MSSGLCLQVQDGYPIGYVTDYYQALCVPWDPVTRLPLQNTSDIYPTPGATTSLGGSNFQFQFNYENFGVSIGDYITVGHSGHTPLQCLVAAAGHPTRLSRVPCASTVQYAVSDQPKFGEARIQSVEGLLPECCCGKPYPAGCANDDVTQAASICSCANDQAVGPADPWWQSS